jgi:hypothetical protein
MFSARLTDILTPGGPALPSWGVRCSVDEHCGSSRAVACPRMRRGIVIGVGVLALFAAVPAAAAAAAAEVQKPNTEAIIPLGESRGYEISLWMPNPRVAVLQVGKDEQESLTYAQSSYGVRVPSDSLKRGLIRLRFPTLGRVSLRFEPRGKRRMPPLRKDCRGKRGVTEAGWFRGTVSLEGEGGSFKSEVRSVRGYLQRSFRLECSKRGEVEPVDPSAPLWEYVNPGLSIPYRPERGSISLLHAAANEGGRSVLVRAAHYEGSQPGAEVQVIALERLAGMPVGRSAYVEDDFPGTLTTSMPGDHPAFATLTPPAPFFGEGNFLEGAAPASNSWSGTLGVSFPGLDLPLTGGQFKTSLCVVSPLKVPAGCDFTKRKLP